MDKQFVTHKIAKQLKKLNFNEKCFGCWEDNTEYGKPFIVGYDLDTPEYYNLKENCIAAPIWQQAIDWIKEKHSISIEIYYPINLNDNLSFEDPKYQIQFINKSARDNIYLENKEEAILKALEIIKQV